MKRFFSAVALCFGLLIIGVFLLSPPAQADADPVTMLLNLPAPPPPNPLVPAHRSAASREDFFSKKSAPGDDAPIEELLEYWSAQSNSYTELGYNIKPSDRVLRRITDEIQRKPETLNNFLNILPETPETIRFVKSIYDRKSPAEETDNEDSSARNWLMYHSDTFSDDLLKSAQEVRDESEYVTNQTELLALARVDWEKARPIVERLYNDSKQPVSQTLARWVMYRRALDAGSSVDAEKYRDELKRVVEDKAAGAGMRDLALDALVKEKEWDGRDEWYYGLLGDESLHDLRVNGSTYTGLTTILYYSPPEKYADKMIELARSSNQATRSAAVRNLSFLLSRDNPEVARALLPWLEDAAWAKEVSGERQKLIAILAELAMPESVGGLISILDEKSPTYDANAKKSSSASSNMMVVAVDEYGGGIEKYPYRSAAINALAKQKDVRAAAPLRRILPELNAYERNNAVRAILASNGFTVGEQISALEAVAEHSPDALPGQPPTQTGGNTAVANMKTPPKIDDAEDDDGDDLAANSSAQTFSVMIVNANRQMNQAEDKPMTAADLQTMLGTQIAAMTEPDEPLLNGVIERINVLDVQKPALAFALRNVVRNWRGAAVNALLLKDLKNGRADYESIVKLLSLRKTLRENQSADIFDARGGNPTALGVASCLLDDGGEYDAVLNGGDARAKTAMFACARLIRAKIPVRAAAENLASADALLSRAAEAYLISEDSPEARSIVLSRHPNEAKILGATMYFAPDNDSRLESAFLGELFASVLETESSMYYGAFSQWDGELLKNEKSLQKELKSDPALLGVYAYDANFVRIYKDKIVFSWSEDQSRFRERVLEPEEFERLKDYLAAQRVDELNPFIAAYCEGCEVKELLTLGRQGGRRIFERADETPEFFAELGKIFEAMRQPPAKLRYELEKETVGLEILYAGDRRQARTAWKEGADLRVLIEDEKQRETLDAELSQQFKQAQEESNAETDYEKLEAARSKIIRQHKYDGFAWWKLDAGDLSEMIAQPPAAEFISLDAAAEIAPSKSPWKARTATFEIRTDGDGLYKIERGQTTKIRSGNYADPLVTPNGRWAIVVKYDPEKGGVLMRVNLTTNKEFPVGAKELPVIEPVAFLAAANKVLIFAGFYNGEEYEHSAAEKVGHYYLLDAETGAVTPAKGDFRPLAQQTFRRLQPAAGSPDEFWTAIPNNAANRTTVGIYNAKTLAIKPVLKIPKIIFDSMAMWADEREKKVYFVYQGHLLALGYR